MRRNILSTAALTRRVLVLAAALPLLLSASRAAPLNYHLEVWSGPLYTWGFLAGDLGDPANVWDAQGMWTGHAWTPNLDWESKIAVARTPRGADYLYSIVSASYQHQYENGPFMSLGDTSNWLFTDLDALSYGFKESGHYNHLWPEYDQMSVGFDAPPDLRVPSADYLTSHGRNMSVRVMSGHIPEPGTLALLGVGALGFLPMMRRRRA